MSQLNRYRSRLTPVQRKQLDEIIELYDTFEGTETNRIGAKLRDEGYPDIVVRAYGEWLIESGLEDNWLLDEMGF